MDNHENKGKMVTDKNGRRGKIVGYGNYIVVDYGGKINEYQQDAFFKGYLKYEDCDLQSEVESQIATIKEKKLKEEQKSEENKGHVEIKKSIRQPELIFKNHGKIIKLEDMFDKDYQVENLKREPILTYQEVEQKFGINIHGFGRGINVTPECIVLVSSLQKKNNHFVYHDKWLEKGIYLYTGEGKIGDHKWTSRNRAIRDAGIIGKSIFLYVKLSPQLYLFQGRVELLDYTYEKDHDSLGELVNQFKFKLKVIE